MWHYTWWNNIKLWSYVKTTSKLLKKLRRMEKNEQEKANKRQKISINPVVRKYRITDNKPTDKEYLTVADNWINNNPKGIDKNNYS